MIYPLLLLAGAAALAFYIREKIRAYTVKAVLLKATVSVLFIAVGVLGMAVSAANPNLMGPLVVMGLVCGLLGDIWLDLKNVFPEQKKPFLYAGFTAFGIGHVLYIAGMFERFFPSDAPAYAIVPIVLAVVLSFGNALLEKPMKLDYGHMKPVVIAYGALLFSTLLVSGSLAFYHGWNEQALNLFFVGAVLFTISDLVLSKTYFGTGHERSIDFVLNYATYYPAQFLIATALMFV
jgi:YhhN-like protein.